MRLPHSLHWRIALAYTALIFVSMGVVSLYLIDFVGDTFVSDLEQRLEQEARLLSETSVQYFRPSLDAQGLQEAAERTGRIVDARVTIIGRDGKAIADNLEDPAVLENHSTRPEFTSALSGGIGRDTRVSETLQRELLYIAVPIQMDGAAAGVARVAVPTAEIQANINRLIATVGLSALIVGFLSIALGYLLARRTSRSVSSVTEGARRLAGGDLEHRVKALASDETQELADAFNRMAATIRDTVRDLSSERNKLSAILETMADGVIVVESDGQVALMNQAAEWLLNVRVANPVGRRIAEVVRDHELQQVVNRCLETKAPQHAEVEFLRRRRFLSAIATPLVNQDSSGVLLTLHDLTRIRQVETTRKEFVTNVSHELRSPLTSIKAMVETLADGTIHDPSVAQDFLQRIHRDVDHMSSLVNDLLELARLESGQTTLHLAPMDIRPLINELVAEFQVRAQPQSITVSAELPDDLPLVTGEEGKLRQVLVNLLENALKFTPGPGKVTLSASVKDRLVEVKVSDTGIGIGEEHLPHIFERFYKVDRARRDGGTGLGLAIVKHIVQAHGGDVSVESAEGAGSVFAFTLPGAT